MYYNNINILETNNLIYLSIFVYIFIEYIYDYKIEQLFVINF